MQLNQIRKSVSHACRERRLKEMSQIVSSQDDTVLKMSRNPNSSFIANIIERKNFVNDLIKLSVDAFNAD